MSTWRYEFADLVTDERIDVLPVDGASFGARIVAAGPFRGNIPIPNRDLAGRAKQLTEGRCVVYPYRDDRLWGGPYILWTVTAASDDRGRLSVGLGGADLASYLAKREIRSDLAYVGVDQLAIADDLIAHMQAVRPEGDLGIVIAGGSSGVLRDRHYWGDEAATYGARLTELAGVIDSFEWRLLTTDAGGVRTRRFVTGYPGLGNATPEHLISQPGDVISWEIAGDAAKGSTSFQARGDALTDDIAEREVPLLSDVVYREDLLAAGWPLTDRTDDYGSVTEVGTLNAHAQQNAAQWGGTVRLASVTIRLPAGGDVFHPDNLGDTARLVLVNDWFPLVNGAPSFSQSYRVVGMDVTPGGRGQQDTAKLIFQGVE